MLDYGAGVSRTMVFANTVEAVEAVAKILGKAGIECFRYHKDSSLEERAKTLVDFREKGGVFVCTDAAARGVDIPDVSHVIQVLLPINYLLLLVSISYIVILITFIVLFKTRRIE
jgi:superfamily II DNA/RNA helicase